MSSQPMPWSSGVRSPIRGATALHVATKCGRLDRDLGRPRQLLPRNLSQEVEGCIGCLGLEYRRGSTKGSCASILGPIAWGLRHILELSFAVHGRSLGPSICLRRILLRLDRHRLLDFAQSHGEGLGIAELVPGSLPSLFATALVDARI